MKKTDPGVLANFGLRKEADYPSLNANSEHEWRKAGHGLPRKASYVLGKTCADCDLPMPDSRQWIRCDDCYPNAARQEDIERAMANQFVDPDSGKYFATPKPKSPPSLLTPAWAASPNFERCWRSLNTLVTSARKQFPDCGLSGYEDLIAQMKSANVIVVPAGQTEALPHLYMAGDKSGMRRMSEAMEEARLPFDTVFLDLGSAEGVSLAPFVGDASVVAAMCYALDDGGIAIVPFCRSHGSEYGGTVTPDTIVVPHRLAAAADPSLTEVGVGTVSLSEEFFGRAGMTEEQGQESMKCAVDAAERILAVVRLLESANVELADPAITRQERRSIERKGGRVALTIRVKQSKRRTTAEVPGTRDFSHRFEVAGHYTHNFEEKPDGTPNKTFERCAKKHPDKVMTIQGKPCVRWWTPPHVKGPVDKPLVPKIRVVQETHGN